MDSDDKKIIEGEITETTTTATDLVTVTNLIQSYISQIDRSAKELAAHKQMLQDAFLNDPTYREHEEKVKEAVKVRSATKMQILKQPTLAELAEKVKDMAQSVKDAKQSLSDYLQEYVRMTSSREIEDSEGELREIVYTAKLVKGASKNSSKR